jgi:dTDP-glucose 4,6-dehydratase
VRCQISYKALCDSYGSRVIEPVNLINPEEIPVIDLAKLITRIACSDSGVMLGERPEDDPSVRRPDITRARTLLEWEPQVGLEEALERTTAWFRTIV